MSEYHVLNCWQTWLIGSFVADTLISSCMLWIVRHCMFTEMLSFKLKVACISFSKLEITPHGQARNSCLINLLSAPSRQALRPVSSRRWHWLYSTSFQTPTISEPCKLHLPDCNTITEIYFTDILPCKICTWCRFWTFSVKTEGVIFRQLFNKFAGEPQLSA